MKISRFPKMMALQRFRAQKLGFDEEPAKAIWIAQATKYAIFKNVSAAPRSAKKSEQSKVKAVPKPTDLDWEQFKVFGLASKKWKPFVGGKVYSSQDYDRYWLGRFEPKTAEAVEKWAQGLIEQVPKEILENEQKFFNNVWKAHRDDEIEVA